MVMSVGLLITTPEHAVFIVLTNIHHRAAEDRILHGWHCNKEMIGQIQRAGGGANGSRDRRRPASSRAGRVLLILLFFIQVALSAGCVFSLCC
jgi:hypothetical protein